MRFYIRCMNALVLNVGVELPLTLFPRALVYMAVHLFNLKCLIDAPKSLLLIFRGSVKVIDSSDCQTITTRRVCVKKCQRSVSKNHAGQSYFMNCCTICRGYLPNLLNNPRIHVRTRTCKTWNICTRPRISGHNVSVGVLSE